MPYIFCEGGRAANLTAPHKVCQISPRTQDYENCTEQNQRTLAGDGNRLCPDKLDALSAACC